MFAGTAGPDALLGDPCDEADLGDGAPRLCAVLEPLGCLGGPCVAAAMAVLSEASVNPFLLRRAQTRATRESALEELVWTANRAVLRLLASSPPPSLASGAVLSADGAALLSPLTLLLRPTAAGL